MFKFFGLPTGDPPKEDKKETVTTEPRQVSELRRDLVTSSWVVIASMRGKRAKSFIEHSVDRERTSEQDCPFEDPQASGNGEPLFIDGTKKEWKLQVIKNKYPAFAPRGNCIRGGICKVGCRHIEQVGPYSIRDGYGFHEVVITRDHDTHWALFSHDTALGVVTAYLERFSFLKKQDCIRHVSIFHNHGKRAGASIYHPHSQIIALPFLPSDIKRSLIGSRDFYKKRNKCPHCMAIEWEKKENKRIIYENDEFIAFCPFVSFGGFEVRIFPKRHQARFDDIKSEHIGELGDALRFVLNKLNGALDNPPYNFFIHTSPVSTKRDYSYYHWHIEILPKLGIDAGFELGTGVQITTIAPEKAAKFLQGVA